MDQGCILIVSAPNPSAIMASLVGLAKGLIKRQPRAKEKLFANENLRKAGAGLARR
jgi:hypothetical protein